MSGWVSGRVSECAVTQFVVPVSRACHNYVTAIPTHFWSFFNLVLCLSFSGIQEQRK